MKLVIQRSKNSSVSVDGRIVNKIDKGMVVLVGIENEDTTEDIDYLVKKTVNLRIFDDDDGIMNKSIIDTNGSILCISQFTLHADTKKGNRPSYLKAMNGDEAVYLYDKFCDELNKFVPTKKGVFGADMKVSILNDGPITIIIDSKNK